MKPIVIILFSILFAITTHAQQHHSDGVDDVLQYAPYAAALTLKAVGVESQSNWKNMALNVGISYVGTMAITYALKHSIKSERPDQSDRYAFPSGHAAVSFAGATILLNEYGKTSPLIPIAGYALATATSLHRVNINRHHWSDVICGALIGSATAQATCWINKRINTKKSGRIDLSFSPYGAGAVWRMP